jgi:hypothetical protein
VTTPPPVRKSAIVTARRGKRITVTADATKEASPSVKALRQDDSAAGAVTRARTSRGKAGPGVIAGAAQFNMMHVGVCPDRMGHTKHVASVPPAGTCQF